MSATYTLKVGWGGNSAFNGARDDVTLDVLEIRDADYGFDGDSRVARVGQMTFILDDAWLNTAAEYGIYTPHNAGSSLAAKFGLNRPVELKATKGATTYALWSGYIESITPRPENHTVEVRCVDGIAPLVVGTIRPEYLINKRSDEAAKWVLDSFVSPRNRAGYFVIGVARLGVTTRLSSAASFGSYETGRQSYDYVGHTWSEDTTIYQALKDVVESEWGYFWVDPTGQTVFKNNHWDIKNRTPDTTLTSGILGIRADYSMSQIVNRAVVQAQPRSVGAAGTVLGQMTTAPGITAGETREITLRFRDEDGGARVTAQVVITPASGTDYVANSERDGTGVAITSSLSVSVTETLASSITMSITNNHATETAYLTTLQVRGTPYYLYDRVEMSAEDITSKGLHGWRDQRVNLKVGDDITFAESLAKYLVRQYKDPHAVISSITLSNATDALETAILSRRVGDVVQLDADAIGVDDDLYRIMHITHRIRGARHEATWDVKKLDVTPFWRLGVSTLGVDTRLGPF